MANDRAIEHWLRERVGPACDALKADPSWAVTAKQIRAHLTLEHQKARAQK
jgi:antitoxin ParD1/3/4